MALNGTGALPFRISPRKWRLRVNPWPTAAGCVALLVATPLLAVLSSLLNPTRDIWMHLWQTQLLRLIWNTAALIIGVGCGVLALGIGLAWLVAIYRFPGRALFEWLLILPLAIPTYVMGFVFLSLFDYTGPVQTTLRQIFGPQVPFPEFASYGGVTLVMTLVLYPYVYMLARTAFAEQSRGTLEAARALGASGRAIFWKVGLPLARPAIAAGVAFALMEALADFGTVAIYGYPTFTVAIYRVWFGMFARGAATELASLLLLFTLALYGMERASRGRARFYQTEGTVRSAPPHQLRGWKAWAATLTVALVIGIAFFVPVGQLALWVLALPDFDRKYMELLVTTVSLSVATALLAVTGAIVIAYGLRLSRSASVSIFSRIASMGYALPGSVIAVGVLVPLSWLDSGLDAFLQRTLGVSSGLFFTGSMIGLVSAYLVRFLAISCHTVDASLAKITPSMDMAGRSLGASASRVLRRIHLPLIRRGLTTAAILVFVDVMKEMPATLLLRPFGYDTLAVRVWQFTSESFWEAAALPALTIVAAGILPVVLLVRAGTGSARMSQ